MMTGRLRPQPAGVASPAGGGGDGFFIRKCGGADRVIIEIERVAGTIMRWFESEASLRWSFRNPEGDF